MSKFLIMISSCHDSRYKRDAQREAWVSRIGPETHYFFYVGKGDTRLETDVVAMDSLDGYNDMPQKTPRAIRYAVSKYKFDWLVRVDDDSFMVPERLPSLFWDPKAEYIGSDRCAADGYATGGAGMILSRRLAEYIASCPMPEHPFSRGRDQDDGWIGSMVRLTGCPLYSTPRLRHGYRTNVDLRPDPYNDVVTGHRVDADEMVALGKKFWPISSTSV